LSQSLPNELSGHRCIEYGIKTADDTQLFDAAIFKKSLPDSVLLESCSKTSNTYLSDA